jgi:tRNA-specific 2-thiouridylase
MFPVGAMNKSDVRAHAARLGLRTASKPGSAGRVAFLGKRIPFRPAAVVDSAGAVLGTVPAVEMITLGQRRGIGLPGGGPKRFVVDVDVDAAVVTVGNESDLLVDDQTVREMTWVHGPDSLAANDTVLVQCSAHGTPQPATVSVEGGGSEIAVQWLTPQRRIAPGQSVVIYDPSDRFVLAGGIAAR